MKEICINVDEYNRDSINTIQGNNNAETYKIYVLFNKRRIDLTGKTAKMAYLRTGTVEGDVINLNVTNATEGEITLQITNSITKRDGVYSCQLAIYGADGFLEHTATFVLTVEANIFNKITSEIANTKDFTYIENILEQAKTVSGELKNIMPGANAVNDSLESNISNASNVNSTLLNTTEKSKVAATDAIEKKEQLETSLAETKKYIDGLDGSQNIPQIRLDVTELQNGLKGNQFLAYADQSSYSIENSLEGMTTDMVVRGRTLQNLWNIKTTGGFYMVDLSNGYFIENNKIFRCEPNVKYSIIYNEKTPTDCYASVLYKDINGVHISEGANCKNGEVVTFTTPSNCYYLYTRGFRNNTPHTVSGNGFNFIIIKGELKDTINYFEGIKSFGEEEKVGDKYKLSFLSKSKNLFNKKTDLSNWWASNGELYKGDSSGKKYSVLTKAFSGLKYIINIETQYKLYTFLDDNFNVLGYGEGKNTQVAPVGTTKLLWYLDPGGIDKNLYDKIQIEPGTISTEYQEYQSDKKDILIKEPLRSVGNIQDVLYEDDGQVKVERVMGQDTLNGDENIERRVMVDETKTIGFGIQVSNLVNCKIGGNCLCNNFKYSYPDLCWNTDNECVSISDFLHFRIDKSKLSTPDIAGFKAWLKANPTTVAYQLATQTTEIVENCVDIDLDTYQDVTYVNIENSIKGTLEFKVASNIGSMVQNMAKEVNNIWDVINELLVPNILKANGNLALLKLNNNLN